ncbi:MAG: protease modulator HflK, partial [Acidobacteriota bacterium]|nr:protease modulator HflK [Acidobacteriota bacterium]
MSLLVEAPLSRPAPELVPPDAGEVSQWTARRVLGILLVLWSLSGIYLVAPEQQAVVSRFGKVVEMRVLPGIHYAWPWPVDRVAKLKTQQLQRLVVGGDLPDSVLGRTQPLASQFLTGDQNIINMRVVVQYSVGVPADYLFQSQDVAKAVGSAVESELARRIARRNVDAILTTEKVAIQDEVRAAAQRDISGYRAGVLLSTVNIESVTPPPEAADAFRDVASARADAVRTVSESQGYANDLVPRARGAAR